MMHIHQKLGFALLGLIWGSNFVFMHVAVAAIAPLQVVWVRVLLGALPVVLWAAARRSLRVRHLRHAHHFLAMALFANVLPFYFLVKGAQLLPSGIAGVISGAIPLMTALLALWALPGERLGAAKAGGLAVGFAGVLLVAEAWNKHGGLLGESFILLGALSYAVAFVYARRFLSPLGIPALALAAYQTAAATLVLSLVTDLHGVGALAAHPPALLAAGAGLGILGTGLAYILYYDLIERMGAVAASSVTYVPPVVALAIGTLVMHDRLSPWQALGAACIVGSIYLVRKVPAHA
jgi:drug/metabolite transporter (DMT)-like permease